MPILHSFFSTHKLKWMQLLTACQTYQCIQKTYDLLLSLFYIPLHSFKMSEWASALQPNIPAKLTHSQHHAFHSLDTQPDWVLTMYNKRTKYCFRSFIHTPVSISARFEASDTQDITDSCVLHHPPLNLQVWYLNIIFNVEVPSKLLTFLNPSTDVNLEHQTVLRD